MDREDEIEQLTAQLRTINIRLAQLETAAAARDRVPERSAEVAAATTLKKGDRVKINNKLKRPATWNVLVEWNQDQAQKATVTHLYKEQVHFVTDNGVKTWRAANNLTKLVEG
jgi:hypothetical protein